VTHVGSSQVAPDGATVRNPAFDVTPHKYITAIITDRGVFTPPFDKSLIAAVYAHEADNARLPETTKTR
jgi:methylthioribose-1-phosphate isomerase